MLAAATYVGWRLAPLVLWHRALSLAARPTTPREHTQALVTAARHLRLAVRLRPNDWRLRESLSTVLIELSDSEVMAGDHQQRLALIRDAIKQFPTGTTGYYALGTYHEDLGEFRLAEEAYRKGLRASVALSQNRVPDEQFPLVSDPPEVFRERPAAVLSKEGKRKAPPDRKGPAAAH